MIDRFRYLPAVHDAIRAPAWWDYDAPSCPYHIGAGGLDCIDLAHPAGWDHAVRAVAALVQVKVDESESVNFWLFSSQPKAVWAVAADGLPHHFMAESGEGRTFTPDLPALQCDRDPYDGHHVTCGCRTTPEMRREALCRCVCAALNLNPEEVFPDV